MTIRIASLMFVLCLAHAGRCAAPLATWPDGKGKNDHWPYDPASLRDKDPRVLLQFSKDNRFGIVQLDAKDPDNKDAWKNLTFSDDGATNNTSVKIAGHEYVFGSLSSGISEWEPPKTMRVALPGHRKGYVSKMNYPAHKVLVTQHVEIVPGRSGLLDTCLVYYSISNRGNGPQKVGLRFLLDVYVGRNDGVPFLVPGRKGFVDEKLDLVRDKKKDEIPDYLEAVENPDDARDPGTTVRLGLRGIRRPPVDLVEPGKSDLVEPSLVRICRWPGRYARWEWEPQSIKPEEKGESGDSCVAIYWPEEVLPSKQIRQYAFTYGLSGLEIKNGLALSVPSSALPDREFVVTCYVYDARKGQKVTLNLPKGLTFSGGEKADKTVEETAGRTAVFWRVKAARDSTYAVTAESSKAKSKETKVVVKAESLFR